MFRNSTYFPHFTHVSGTLDFKGIIHVSKFRHFYFIYVYICKFIYVLTVCRIRALDVIHRMLFITK